MDPALGHAPGLGEFTRFYREHLGYVRHVVGHLGVPHAVEDVVQETFVTAYRRFSSLRPDASPRAWLAGIARRTAYRWRRTVQRGLRRTHALRMLSPPASRDPGRLLDASRFLQRFLASLDADKRDVFVMAEVAQLRAPEIADALGINPNTVYTRLRASRQLLVNAAEAEGLASVDTELASASTVEQPTPAQARAAWLLLLPRLGEHKALSSGLAFAMAWIGRPAVRWAATLGLATFVGTGLAGYGHADEAPPQTRVRPVTAHAGLASRVLQHQPAPSCNSLATPAASLPERADASPPRGDRRPPRDDALTGATLEGVSRRGPASIANETALLERAVTQLSTRPRRALALAREHARRFPESQLSEAAVAVEVRALCRLGRTARARERAASFVRRFGSSHIALTAAQACEVASGS